MDNTSRFGALRRGVHCALVCAAVIVLAGCATRYDLVQPQAADSGSYYTGAGPYATGYAAGAYYPSAGVYGYSDLQPYVFTSAFDFGFPGTFGWGYPWAFAGGIGAPWGWGGLGYAPWYNNFAMPPVWGCRYNRCRRHRHWRQHDHAHAGHSTAIAAGQLATPPALAPRGALRDYHLGLRPEIVAARRVDPAMLRARPLVRAPIHGLDLARPADVGAATRLPMRPPIERLDTAQPMRMGNTDMTAPRAEPALRNFAPEPALRSARPVSAPRPVRMAPMRAFSAPAPAPQATPHRAVSHGRVR